MTKFVKPCVLQVLNVDVNHLAQQKQDGHDVEIIAPGVGFGNLAGEVEAGIPPA